MKKLFFIILICSSLIYAQSSKNTFQNWLDFNESYSFNKQWKIFGDAGYRIIISDNTYHRIYTRPAGAFQLNSVFILHAGIALFLTFNEGKTLRELRPFQGLVINYPKFPSFPLTQYIRFEERFFNLDQTNTLIYRGRYQLGTKIRFDDNKSEKYYYIPLQLEWFVNWNDKFNFRANEFRVVVGAGYVFDTTWRFEFNTIFQNLDASLEEVYSFHDIIFRFRVYKEFNTGL